MLGLNPEFHSQRPRFFLLLEFSIFLLLAVPEQWIVTVSHSVGYMTLILFVALAFVYKVTVVQEPVRGMPAFRLSLHIFSHSHCAALPPV